MTSLVERARDVLLDVFASCMGVLGGALLVCGMFNIAPDSPNFQPARLILGIVACFALASYVLYSICDIWLLIEETRQ
jgi:hypothetical protein